MLYLLIATILFNIIINISTIHVNAESSIKLVSNIKDIDVTSGTDINIVSPDTIKYNEMLVKLNKLEDLTIQYKNDNPQISQSRLELMLIYIRCERYNSFKWNFLAGYSDSDFEAYISKNSGNINVKSLKQLNNLISPTTFNLIDFGHMFATMNMIEENLGIVGGWGGDTCQLATDIKNEIGSLDVLSSKATTKLCTSISQFNQEDMYADLDAENITNIYKNPNNTLSLAIVIDNYYKNIDNSKRVAQFVTNTLGNTQITKSNLREIVYKKLLSGRYINSLLQSYMIDTEEYTNHVLAASNSFADYLYNNYPKVKPNSLMLSVHNLNMDIGQTYKLNPSLLPVDTSNNKILYSSSDETIATVDEFGTVYIKKIGKVIISCMSDENNELIDSCTINNPVLMTNINLSMNKITLTKNQILQLEPVITPSNTTNKLLKFESSNKNIIDINENGLIKAVNSGTSIVTCTSTDGSLINSKCEVIVIDEADTIFTNKNINSNVQNVTTNYNIIPETNDSTTLLGLLFIIFLSLNICIFVKSHHIS